MGEPPGQDLFDFDDDDDLRTVVDSAFWDQPKVPDYPPLAHFGRFEILGRIARGGMAEVYLSREWDDEGKARHLVLKRVLPEMEDHPDLIQMFLDEGDIAKRLYHPNVCHVYEVGVIEAVTFMSLEWVWGTSLHDAVERSARKGACLPWPVVVELVSQIAAALHYVHHAKGVGGKPLNIVHRDVSPHNVMLSWSGAVKLLDFGIAKTSQESGGATAGKYGYMSPEQARSGPVDPRSDIFALGIVLFEALTGRRLYERPTLLDSLSAIIREPVPSLRAERPELPEALEHIVHRALAKHPDHRFQSAGELKASLSQVLRSQGQAVSPQRIALTLDALYSPAEKEPLKQEGRTTSSFDALTLEGERALASQESVTYETFDHSAPSIPPVAAAPAPKKPARAPSILLWIGLVIVAGLMAGIGAAAAIWLLS